MGEEVVKKAWYTSKTIWVNLIALVSAVLVGVGVLDVEISVETVAVILTVINFLLRFITKEEIVWS